MAAGGEHSLNTKLDWAVDSGCSAHMCNNKNLFVDFQQVSGFVEAAGKPAQVCGIGTVKFVAVVKSEQVTVTLVNTLFIPSLPVNLISQAKLDVAGMYVNSKSGFRVLNREDDLVVLEASQISGLYVVNRAVESSMSLVAWQALVASSGKNTLQMWHERGSYWSGEAEAAERWYGKWSQVF